MRIAALLYIADAGFGIAMPITLAHLARTGELPMTPIGFPSFTGQFEQLGRIEHLYWRARQDLSARMP